jgi:hypothetical protein
LNSNTFPTPATTSPNIENIVLSDFSHIKETVQTAKVARGDDPLSLLIRFPYNDVSTTT